MTSPMTHVLMSSPGCPQTGWCYRRKENFVFRYDALEDELPVAPLP